MRRLVALALAAAALSTVGCGGGQREADRPLGVDWDLSEGHAVPKLDRAWRRVGAGRSELRPQDRVVLRLPTGPTFNSGSGGVARMLLQQEGGRISSIAVVSPPLSLDAAGSRARGWARQLRVMTADIDEWVRRQRATSGRRSATFATGGGVLDDVAPVVRLTRHPRTESPAEVSVELTWR